MQNKQDIL